MKKPTQILLTKEEVLEALQKSLNQNFIDNLRNRHPNVSLDSKLRGYVGEIAFKKWANANGIEFENSNIKDYSSGMDIDFLFKNEKQSLAIELKTSLIPDSDLYLEEVIRKRDIKLIRRNGKSIEQLDADIHVQIIFKQLRLRKDDWLKKQPITFKENINTIYDQLAAYRYEKDCYLVGWIDKKTLIKQINSKPQHLKKWKYGKREFWCCGLNKDAKPINELTEMLVK